MRRVCYCSPPDSFLADSPRRSRRVGSLEGHACYVLESYDNKTVIRLDIGAFDKERSILTASKYFDLNWEKSISPQEGEPALPAYVEASHPR